MLDVPLLMYFCLFCKYVCVCQHEYVSCIWSELTILCVSILGFCETNNFFEFLCVSETLVSSFKRRHTFKLLLCNEKHLHKQSNIIKVPYSFYKNTNQQKNKIFSFIQSNQILNFKCKIIPTFIIVELYWRLFVKEIE